MITIQRGFCPCSTARWIFVVSPPRECPGCGHSARRRFRQAAPSAGSLFRRPDVLVVSADSGGDVHLPGDQALRVGLSLHLGHDPRPSAISLSEFGTGRRPSPRSVAFRHITPGVPVRVRHRIPSISCRRVHTGGRPCLMPCGNNDSSCPPLAVRQTTANRQSSFTIKINFWDRS